MRGSLIRAVLVAASVIGFGTAAAVPAMASTASCPPGSLTCAGGNTNLTATVNDEFTVVGFPTAVAFNAVAPGAVTAGTASNYSITTNHGTGYSVTVAIDPADAAINDGYLANRPCPEGPLGPLGQQADIMIQSAGCAFIPLDGGALTVQHALAGQTSAQASADGWAVFPLPQSGSPAVTIVTTSAPESGNNYGDLFTLQIPGGTQASGQYTAILDYVLAENA